MTEQRKGPHGVCRGCGEDRRCNSATPPLLVSHRYRTSFGVLTATYCPGGNNPPQGFVDFFPHLCGEELFVVGPDDREEIHVCMRERHTAGLHETSGKRKWRTVDPRGLSHDQAAARLRQLADELARRINGQNKPTGNEDLEAR